MSSRSNRLQRPILTHRKTKHPLFGRPKTGRRFVVERNGRRSQVASVKK